MLPIALFLKSAALGLAVAAPVGPMSLLCMRRTLAAGWRQGLATGCGIALGDAAYATVAALGLAGLSAALLAEARPLHAAVGLVLLWLGLRGVLARPAPAEARGGAAATPGAALASAALLTLANPPTIVTFVALFAALAPPAGLAGAAAFATVTGVFAGSILWWCSLVAACAVAGRTIGPWRRWLDRGAGAALALLGAAELGRAAGWIG
jgi:threonine/homoserine/homoserine lactone efflux protein